MKILIFNDRHNNLQVFEDIEVDVRDVLPDFTLRGNDVDAFLSQVIYDLGSMDSPLCGFTVEVEINKEYFSAVKTAYQVSRKIMLKALLKNDGDIQL